MNFNNIFSHFSRPLNDGPLEFFRKNDIDFMLNLFDTLEQMKSIPKNRHYNVVFKLYYNDNVPMDYEPPGFVPHISKNNENLNIINNITTSEQFFSIQIKTCEESLKSSDYDEENSFESNIRSQKLRNLVDE